MNQTHTRRWLAASALLLSAIFAMVWGVGCTGEPPTTEPPPRREPPTPTGPTYFSQAKTILDSHCGGCHKEKGIGPFDLTNYDQIVKIKALIKEQIQSKKMPPWQADMGCNEYAGASNMPEDQSKALLKWLDDGAAKGDAANYKAPPKQAATGLSRVDLTLKLPIKYTPKQSPDDYRCFLIDWPHKETKFITGYRFSPDNKAIVHHVIAYVIPPKKVQEFQALDDKEEGAGYTCFGGPGGSQQQDVGFLGGWAPGAIGGDFPAGTGMRVEPGSKIVLQMHYNVVGTAPATDQSSAEFKIDDNVAIEAKVQPFTNPSWLDSKQMHIPAGEASVKHQFAWDIASLRGSTLNVHTASLHMHLRGRTAKLLIERKDGSETCLLHIPRWDFNWQRSYSFKKPVELNPGDKLKIQCSWDNGKDSQPVLNGKRMEPKDIYWGEGTNDEMCVGFLYMTNKE